MVRLLVPAMKHLQTVVHSSAAYTNARMQSLWGTRQAAKLTVEVVAAVANHGMDQNLIGRQFAASKAFFALPLGIKLKLKVRLHASWTDYSNRMDRLLHSADSLSLTPIEAILEAHQGTKR